MPVAPSLTFTLLVGVSWITAVIVWADNQRANALEEDSRSCIASSNVLSGIQLVPYKLRAVDAADVVPTLEQA
jgi:hypothetical protein